MLSIANEFGKQLNGTFNVLKYQLLVHVYPNSDNQIKGLEHNGIFITALPYVNLLGNLIGPKLRDNDVSYVTDNFCSACNIILNTFSKLSCRVRYKLFKTYCIPQCGFLQWDFLDIILRSFLTIVKMCEKNLRSQIWGFMSHS